MKDGFILDRRGISTIVIASVLFLILTLSTLFLLVSGFFGYNLAVDEQMKIEQERSQEKIILTDIGLNENATFITFVRINNTGTIGVRIRAIYESYWNQFTGYVTAFLEDPSTYMDTHIEPNRNLIIRSPPNATYIASFRNGYTRLILATERGTKTSDFEGTIVYGHSKPPQPYNTSRYYIGPLELMFTAFYYRRIDSQTGVLDPADYWHPGWDIARSYGYVAWNITVRNIDNRNITINKYSSFTVVPNESPPSDERTWYLDPVERTDNTQSLVTGQVEFIVYKWSVPIDTGVKAQQIYSVPTRCLVFLTFYGLFHEADGTTTTYAQTIPFEAAITVL